MQKAVKKNKEDILVQHFLTCSNVSQISRETGMSRNTIYSIMQKDTFMGKLLKAREDALQNTISFCKGIWVSVRRF